MTNSHPQIIGRQEHSIPFLASCMKKMVSYQMLHNVAHYSHQLSLPVLTLDSAYPAVRKYTERELVLVQAEVDLLSELPFKRPAPASSNGIGVSGVSRSAKTGPETSGNGKRYSPPMQWWTSPHDTIYSCEDDLG